MNNKRKQYRGYERGHGAALNNNFVVGPLDSEFIFMHRAPLGGGAGGPGRVFESRPRSRKISPKNFSSLGVVLDKLGKLKYTTCMVFGCKEH
jgi:hypothetical protein